jgi:hypothetical protein
MLYYHNGDNSRDGAWNKLNEWTYGEKVRRNREHSYKKSVATAKRSKCEM